jgi:hypothetical protein
MYFEGELPVMSYGGNCGNQNNGWTDFSWIIGLALVGGLFGGWGNGFGFGGGFGGGRGGYDFPCGTPATQADLANGFAQNTLQRGIDDIILGQAQMQNFINQGFSGLNQTVTGGFAGVNNAICTLGYQQAQLVNGLSRELGDCCCATQRAIEGVKFENCQNTAAIIGAINAGNQRLVDIYTADKMEALRAENTALKGRISDDYQADRIISRLSPCPSPAYIVPNPNCCYQYGVSGVGYTQSGCACGC